MKSYAVIGLGRFGTKAAECLYEYGADVLAIDIDEELVNNIADKVTRAAVADAKDKKDLHRLGVNECDCVIIALGSNLAASVLITMNVKALGVKNVICKAHDDIHREILEKLGADKVIIPERDAAEKTVRALISPDFLDFVELSDEYGIIQIAPPKSWVGKEIRELTIRNKYNVNIIAVTDGEKTRVSIPADYKIEADINLVLLGEYDNLNRIQKLR